MIDAIDALEAFTPPNFESPRDQVITADAAEAKYGKGSSRHRLFMQMYNNSVGRGNASYFRQMTTYAAEVVTGITGAAMATVGIAAEKGFHPEVGQAIFLWGKDIVGQLPGIGAEAIKVLNNIQPEQVPVLLALGGGALIARGGIAAITAENRRGIVGKLTSEIKDLKMKLLEPNK